MAEFSRVLPVHIPTVGFKGRDTTDAKAFRTAADKLDRGYDVGGSNMRAAVARLLRGAAEALDKAGQPDPEWSFWEHQQRQGGH